MEKIFYATDAYIKEYAQGAYLIMIKSLSGAIYGLSCEFEVYTQDIVNAAVKKNEEFNITDERFDKVNWIEFDSEVGTIPASWEDIKKAGLSDYVIGYQLESEVEIHRFS
ncbi:hypothetical protein PSCICO_41530 [Pseudomonas cichorii]|uniref:hypothetical protein n=1 Tax=Pseudomonas cichorii TaxID=36746 RepID=UPI00190FC895|nr:hypothetical protein [Pseudomonas cichorii]GFM88754.1 hypothetical protein PSCICO_41530 [Pseudomonas cichorii]